jgi:hypothetical protein
LRGEQRDRLRRKPIASRDHLLTLGDITAAPPDEFSRLDSFPDDDVAILQRHVFLQITASAPRGIGAPVKLRSASRAGIEEILIDATDVRP